MKRFTKVLSILVVCILSLFALTSCDKKAEENKTYKFDQDGTLVIEQIEENGKTSYSLYVVYEEKVLVAEGTEEDTEEKEVTIEKKTELFESEKSLLGLVDEKNGKLYLSGATISKGEYKVVVRTSEMPKLKNKMFNKQSSFFCSH